jgi:hypothetical protein
MLRQLCERSSGLYFHHLAVAVDGAMEFPSLTVVELRFVAAAVRVVADGFSTTRIGSLATRVTEAGGVGVSTETEIRGDAVLSARC